MRRATTRIRGYRFLLAPMMLLAMLSAAGCGTVGQTVGASLGGTGLVATGTGILLAAGCTTPDPNNPALDKHGQPCLPAETYETYKPAILTTITLGLILIGAGIAVYSVSSPPPEKTVAPPRPPPPPESEETREEKKPCKEYCF